MKEGNEIQNKELRDAVIHLEISMKEQRISHAILSIERGKMDTEVQLVHNKKEARELFDKMIEEDKYVCLSIVSPDTLSTLRIKKVKIIQKAIHKDSRNRRNI